MSEYFVLQVDHFVEPAPGLTRVNTPPAGFEPSQWMQGRRLAEPPGPIEAEIYRSGGGLSEVFLSSIPLFREDVVQALEAAGVDNLQAFPARIVDTERQQVLNDYRAVNIVGCVAAADLTHSDYTPAHAPALRTDFRKLVIDGVKARGLLIFRLLESIDTIVLHAHAKQALQRDGFRYLRFIPA